MRFPLTLALVAANLIATTVVAQNLDNAFVQPVSLKAGWTICGPDTPDAQWRTADGGCSAEMAVDSAALISATTAVGTDDSVLTALGPARTEPFGPLVWVGCLPAYAEGGGYAAVRKASAKEAATQVVIFTTVRCLPAGQGVETLMASLADKADWWKDPTKWACTLRPMAKPKAKPAPKAEPAPPAEPKPTAPKATPKPKPAPAPKSECGTGKTCKVFPKGKLVEIPD